MFKTQWKWFPMALSITMTCGVIASTTAHAASESDSDDAKKKDYPVTVEMFAPAKGDHVGIGGRGWFVDLAIQYETPLENTGFNGFQITGPAGHNNIAPFPGTFSAGADEHLPGLVVLLSTSTVGAGSCQNLANLFNLTGVTDADAGNTEIWDTWLIGAPNFGVNTKSTIYVAVVDDLNQDGIYNDAPGAITDINGDGNCDSRDLRALGLASNIAKVRFYINP